MNFTEEHEKWLQMHINKRTGERKERLIRGHGHAEKLLLKNVWWPQFRHFKFLHPEYEVFNLKGGSRFIDFAFIHALFLIAIEIDGFGPHVREMSRWKFSDQLNRQNELVATGWHVLRFSYDDILDRPATCRHIIQLTMGRFLGQEKLIKPDFIEKELIRLAVRLVRPLTPTDVAEHFSVDVRTARKYLYQLREKGLLQPYGEGKQRIRKYALSVKNINGLL